MTGAFLEHVNLTVANPEKTAQFLCQHFGWHIRWQGPALAGGFTVHVGTEQHYLALYRPKTEPSPLENDNYLVANAVNHIAIVVPDLAKTEQGLLAANIHTHSHADYEPGRRFYFDHDDIEFEVVSYH